MTRQANLVIAVLVVISSAMITEASFVRPLTRVVHHYHAPLPRLVHRHVHLHEPARLVRYYAPAPPPVYAPLPLHVHPVEEIVEPAPYYPYAWRKK